MPEIRPFIASERVDGGGGAMLAPESAFDRSAGTEVAARGLSQVAGAMSEIAARQQAERKRIEEEQSVVWVGETVENERRHWLDWMASKDNVQDPNIAENFTKYAKDRVTALASSAPNSRAAASVRLQLGSTLTRNYSEAVEMGRRSSLAKLGQSFDARAATGMTAYRSGGKDSMLVETLTGLYSDIDRTIGAYSSATAEQLKAKYELDGIYAAIDTSPDFARKMVAQSTWLDERQRSMLTRAIDEAVTRVDAETRYNFEQQRADARARWEVGKDFNELPLSAYEAVYPKDVARAKKAEDDSNLRVMSGVFKEYANIQEKHPLYQSQHLANLSKAIKGEEDALKVRYLSDKVAASAKLLDQDPVAWLMTNNSTVRKLTEEVRSVPAEERPEVLRRRAQAIIRMQSRAPEGEDREKFLDLPDHNISLLTTGEAEEYAARVNRGTPSEALEAFDALMGQFPDTQHQVIAFNDMVRLPPNGKGVRQELQLAIQNRNAWWLPQYINAINQASGVRQLSVTDTKEFNDKLEGNTKWVALQRALIGDNLQRANELAGFRQGIVAFAQSMTLNGMSTKDSIDKSVEMLFGETLGVATVNGRPLAVSRASKKGQLRTDDEVMDLGRRLSVALSVVDPAKIDASIMNLGTLPDNDVARFQAVRDQITTQGFYQPTQDGQGVTLYIPDALGNPIQVRDKRGKPFRIMFDDLPMMLAPRTIYGRGTTPSRTVQEPIYPKSLYDLMEKEGSDLMGTTEYRSFWPIQPAWLRNE